MIGQGRERLLGVSQTRHWISTPDAEFMVANFSEFG